MNSAFWVITTSHFDRAFRKLARRHAEMQKIYPRIVRILETDPCNRSHSHDIKKLEDIPAGDGQYRIRSGRFRFRYDLEKQVVYLKYCGLRREETYD